MSWRDNTDFRSCLLASELPGTPLNFGGHAAGRRYEAGAIPHELNEKDRQEALFLDWSRLFIKMDDIKAPQEWELNI